MSYRNASLVVNDAARSGVGADRPPDVDIRVANNTSSRDINDGCVGTVAGPGMEHLLEIVIAIDSSTRMKERVSVCDSDHLSYIDTRTHMVTSRGYSIDPILAVAVGEKVTLLTRQI